MARIRYQPATKTKGFQPIQLTTAGISRMREETNRVVQGMEKNLAAEQRQREENLKAMQDDAAYTEQITKENRDIEVQNLKNEQLSITQTAQRDQQQAQYDADATRTIMSSLVDFSDTIAKIEAKNKAKQLEDQQDVAMATDRSSFLNQASLDWNNNWGSLYPGAMQNGNAIVEQGTLGGEEISKTFKTLSREPGRGAIANNITVNDLTVETRNLFYNKAITGTEKMYPDGRGGFFSGLEAAQDTDKHRILKQIVREQTFGYIRKATKYTDPNALQDAYAAINKQEKLEDGRVETASVAVAKDSMRQQAAVLYSGKNPNQLALAYDNIKTVDGFKAANTSAFNALVATDDQAKVDAFANMPMPDGKTFSTSPFTKDGYAQAIVRRDDRINARNRENRRVRKETLDNNLYEAREPILQRLNENPEEIYEKVTKEYYAQGATPPSWFKEAYRSATTGANEKFAEELATLQRTGGVVSAKRINAERNLTNREKLVKLRSAQIEQQYGGQAGLDQLKGLEALARTRTNIAPNGGRNSPITYTLLAGMEKRWKEHFAATQDVVKATELLEADLFEADEKKNPNALFTAKYDNNGNALSYPNLNSTDLDTDQRLTLLQTKVVAKRSLGEITDMPGMLGEPSALAAISVQSETSNNIQFTRETMYLAAKFGKKPSEIHNAQVMANNKAFGTNTPLINPTIKSEAIDNASPKDARMMNSVFRAQNIQGYANYAQQFSAPGQGPLDLNRRLVYRTGNIGPTSTGEHLDVKQVGGGRFEPSDLDQYVRIQDPEYGEITLSELGRRLPGRGDNFDQHVARGSHGIDFPTASGTQVYLTNGAKEISNTPTEHGNYLVFETPSGKRYSFLHGKAASQ